MKPHALVAEDLERRISAGEFATGARLPSELALAQAYDTTRARIRTALASLGRRGLVASHPGIGWIVVAGQHSQTVGEVLTFSQWAAAHGRTFGGLIVHRERDRATVREATGLGIRLGEEVVRYVRVRTLDGRPVLVERSTWAQPVLDAVESFPDDVPSVFGALADAGHQAVLADHRIEAVPASSQDAQLLHVRRSTPVLQIGRISTTPEGRPLEVATDRYLPGFVTFDVRAQDVVRTLVPRQG